MAAVKLEMVKVEVPEYSPISVICTICSRKIEENERVYINDNRNELVFVSEIDLSVTYRISCQSCMKETSFPTEDFKDSKNMKIEFDEVRIKEEQHDLEIIDDKFTEFNADTSCNEGFSEYTIDDKNGLIHGNKTLKKLHCDKCDYSSSRINHLKKHLLVHNTEKPFKCDHCAYSTKCKKYLKMHVGLHLSDKPYKCVKCDFCTHNKRCLVKHIRIHSTKNPYKCTQCNYVTTLSARLKAHLLEHDNEKPFKCHTCDFRTRTRQSLNRHFKTHIVEKSLKCDHCAFRTKYKDSLKVHLSSHMNEKFKLTAHLVTHKTEQSTQLKYLKKHRKSCNKVISEQNESS